jgi:hypothetical protein
MEVHERPADGGELSIATSEVDHIERPKVDLDGGCERLGGLQYQVHAGNVLTIELGRPIVAGLPTPCDRIGQSLQR